MYVCVRTRPPVVLLRSPCTGIKYSPGIPYSVWSSRVHRGRRERAPTTNTRIVIRLYDVIVHCKYHRVMTPLGISIQNYIFEI